MNNNIPSLKMGDKIEGFYILKAAYPKTTANGKPFLSMTVADRSGEIEGVVWDYAGSIGTADVGKVVRIRGNISEYRGTLQVTAEQIRLATDDDPVDVSALVPVAPVDRDMTCYNFCAVISDTKKTKKC